MSTSQQSSEKQIKWTSSWELAGQRLQNEEALHFSRVSTMTRGCRTFLEEMARAKRLLQDIRDKAQKESRVFIHDATEESWEALDAVMSISLLLNSWTDGRGLLTYYWTIQNLLREDTQPTHQILWDYIHREAMKLGVREAYAKRFTSLRTVLDRCFQDLAILPPQSVVKRVGLKPGSDHDDPVLFFQYIGLDPAGDIWADPLTVESMTAVTSPGFAWSSSDPAFNDGVVTHAEDPRPISDITFSTMT